MTPQELKTIISQGLLSFPVTDFDRNGDFSAGSYAARLEWLAPHGASALFAAGGTGEFFSLTPSDYTAVVKTAVDVCNNKVPILAGAGGPTRTAIAYALEAQRLGAKGILLMPHYLTEASEAGIEKHVEEVCNALDIGVIFYNRAYSRLGPHALARLADRCPNLIGFKDGVGDIEAMVKVRRTLGSRLSYLGGLPTAEVFAAAYKALGVPVYSSAVFNFIPETAMQFYRAVSSGDTQTTDHLLDTFFLPYLAIRDRCAGYAVSIVKAGTKLVGYDAGPVRAPLTELLEPEVEQLADLIKKVGGK